MRGPAPLRILAAGLAAAVLALCLPAAPAWSHALLQLSYPADGDVLDALPSEVLLSFYEPISPPAYVAITAPDGIDLAVGEAEVADLLVSQGVASSTQEGTFLLAYSAVSLDGHPIMGAISFTVGAVNTLGAEVAGAPAAPVSPTSAASLAAEPASEANWFTVLLAGPPVLWPGLGLLALAIVLYALSLVGRGRARELISAASAASDTSTGSPPA